MPDIHDLSKTIESGKQTHVLTMVTVVVGRCCFWLLLLLLLPLMVMLLLLLLLPPPLLLFVIADVGVADAASVVFAVYRYCC